MIVWDEEHPAGARITLEQDCSRAPFAITLVIYDWTYITRFIADAPTAEHVYLQLRGEMETHIAPLMGDGIHIPDEDALANTMADFVERWN